MNTQRIKSILIRILGERFTACIQALRFVYLLKHSKNPEPEIQLLPRLLNKGDTAVDVGANGASWTYYLHQNVGITGYVFAFEADPYYALATEMAIKFMRLKRVSLFHFGLSDKDEEVPLRVIDSNGLRVSGLGHVDKNADKNEQGVEIVQLKRLDSLIQEHSRILNTKLIKCDVEGYELFVLKGANQLLTKSRPFVILEVGHFGKQGYSARDVYNFFEERGYSAFAMVTNNELSPTDVMLEHEKALSDNRIMIPKEKIAIVGNLIQSPSNNSLERTW